MLCLCCGLLCYCDVISLLCYALLCIRDTRVLLCQENHQVTAECHLWSIPVILEICQHQQPEKYERDDRGKDNAQKDKHTDKQIHRQTW